jgi:DNA-binding transcriptional LysR family regulator
VEIKDLKFFVMVYEKSGFLHAGTQLNTVQSNVSARIRRLEECLGSRLFTRLHRGVRPTHAGEMLYPSAKQLIALADSIEGRLRQESAAARSPPKLATAAADAMS